MDDSVDVLVVGAGPAGLVAGIVLGNYGIRVAVIEKRAGGSTLSRALVISTRCMEMLRAWGLESDVRAGAADVVPRAWVTPSLASDDGVEMPLGYPTAEEAADVSPTYPAWAPQDHLEPLLRAHLSSLPSASLLFGVELIDVVQRDEGVDVTVQDGRSQRRIGARYVIGADGAHSTTRAAVRIAMDGPDDLAEFHRIEFTAPLAPVLGERRYGLYVITNPAVAGVLTPRGKGDRWGLSREWRPGEPRLVDADDADLIELLRTAIGDRTIPLELERPSSFSFAAQIARRYRSGRVFLAGDAAHRMTPRGGTGMNTAMQDAYDVGWRLAWHLRDWASAELLDAYETVRRPVGLHNVERAGQVDGARRDADDALPWDLNGRIAHRWITSEQGIVSSLDLVTEGLTLFAGSKDPRWATAGFDTAAPVQIRILDEADEGARLIGPDAREIVRWRDYDEFVRRGVSEFGWLR